MRHGDEKQGDSAEDEQGEGGAGAGEGPGVVVFNPDGLITVYHTFDRLPHYLDRDDGAKAWVPKRKEWFVMGKIVFFQLLLQFHIYSR